MLSWTGSGETMLSLSAAPLDAWTEGAIWSPGILKGNRLRYYPGRGCHFLRTAALGGLSSRRLPRADANPTRSAAARLSDARSTPLLFLLQAVLILADESPDLVGHAQELLPLLPIERDREASHAVDRKSALLAHLEIDAPACWFLQCLVLRAKPLDLSFQIFI